MVNRDNCNGIVLKSINQSLNTLSATWKKIQCSSFDWERGILLDLVYTVKSKDLEPKISKLLVRFYHIFFFIIYGYYFRNSSSSMTQATTDKTFSPLLSSQLPSLILLLFSIYALVALLIVWVFDDLILSSVFIDTRGQERILSIIHNGQKDLTNTMSKIIEGMWSHYGTSLYSKIYSSPYCCTIFLDPFLNSKKRTAEYFCFDQTIREFHRFLREYVNWRIYTDLNRFCIDENFIIRFTIVVGVFADILTINVLSWWNNMLLWEKFKKISPHTFLWYN